MDHYKLFINGEFVDAASGKAFETIDPGTNLPIATVAQAGEAEAEAAIMAARKAFDSGIWSRLSPQKRMAVMQDFADEVSRQSMRITVIEAMDSGQIIGIAGAATIQAPVTLRDQSLLAANQFPWEEYIQITGSMFGAGRDFIRREPIGVCVGIVPWNFPLAMAIWKISQALVMGNTVVIKPATNTPLSALILAECAQAAGIPKGVLNVITGPGGELGKVLCTHPYVDKVALTGSTEVGREIMKMGADTIKKVTLELGGKSANIILEDADIELAVTGAIFGTFLHQGQVCESCTRVLVHKKIYDEFLEKFKKRTEALRVGYQLDTSSHQGPLISKQQLSTVENYVKIGKDEGAKVVTGGRRVEAPGFNGNYYAPTIFAAVNNKMRIAQEEIFGPVVCVIKYDSDEEAIAIANDSIYGLGGAVFSRNLGRAEHIANEMRTGTVGINACHTLMDYVPFGGYKQSGVGVELGIDGLKEYTKIKHVHVAANGSPNGNIAFTMLTDNKKLDGFTQISPTAITAAHGALYSIQKTIAELGCKRAVIMTDAGVRAAGLADLVKDALGGFYTGMFDKVPSDPDFESVDAAAEYARGIQADCVVSVGGGSVMDCSKGLCVCLKKGGRINDHLNINLLDEPMTPHICIPTTSGTGSEVSFAAIMTNRKLGRKCLIGDPRIMPNAAILDPTFVMSMPKDITISTAMDAMSHAIEALCSTWNNVVADGFALQAIRLISENLPLVVANGKDEGARLNMQVAATLAGLAMNTTSLGVAHALAHSLGAVCHIPHGKACGLVLPSVMRWNVDYATSQLAKTAVALGVSKDGRKERDLALAAADAVEALMKKVGHPTKLRDAGIKKEGLEMVGLLALTDLSGMTNARPVNDPAALIQLLNGIY